MRSIARNLLPVLLIVTLAACSDDAPESAKEEAATATETLERGREPAEAKRVKAATPQVQMMEASTAPRLIKVLQAPHRSLQNRARDAYRHPKETLSFFGLRRNMTVLEITPGAGWYAEILAPTVNTIGRYVAAIWDESVPGQPDYRAGLNKELLAKFASDTNLYGDPQIVRFDPYQPAFGPPESVDMVVSFRNAHNWIEEGVAPAYFSAVHAVLKPGGVFGLTDHRAPAGAPTDGKSGYVTEAQVIELARAAGLELAERSEINANPEDTRDYPQGVWVLPPTLALGDVDKEKYIAIGESDRMTLRFIKR